MAVERPPIGNHPRNRENGLEKVTRSGVICATVSFGPELEMGWLYRGNKYLTNNSIGHLCGRGGEGKEDGGRRGGKAAGVRLVAGWR